MPKQLFKDYFTFSHSERRGIIVLIILILVIISIRISYPYFQKKTNNGLIQFKKDIDEWEQSQVNVKKQIRSSKKIGAPSTHSNFNHKLFRFDPNTVTPEGMKKLGFKSWSSNALINFRINGGKFYKKEDLLKIYGFDSSDFRRLKPYIQIKQKDYNTSVSNSENKNFESSYIIEINKATESDFKKLPGIGFILSKRIIKYRNLLGGFYSINQLKEVYGIHDSTLFSIKNRLKTDTIEIRKINLNKTTVTSLSQHPYISSYMAKSIINYKKYRGKIESLTELKTNNIIPDSLYYKTIFYFTVK